MAPYRAQHAATAAGAGHLRCRGRDDHRGDPVVHRRRHPAQRPELGQYHGRGAQLVSGRLLHRAVPRDHAVLDGAGDEPLGRRAARRARPAPRAAAVRVPMAAIIDAIGAVAGGPLRAAGMGERVLEVADLKTWFFTRDGVVHAVDGVSFHVMPGATVAIVGESGCGKSVTALSILRLVPSPPGRIVAGTINFAARNLLDLSDAEMRDVRGNDISMIFQEPMTSLNPVLTIGRQIGETLILHQGLDRKAALAKATDMLRLVHIPEARRRVEQYPHQLSGGMRQRVMIAMALACNPKLLIADEPTTALDVTIQAQILDLMRELKQKIDAAIVLITHDLGVVAEMAQRVVVMYAGRKAEEAPVRQLFGRPLHPYTKGLLNSVPKLGASLAPERLPRLAEIRGTVPSLKDEIPGCPFAERCAFATEICRREMPDFEEKEASHYAACFHSDQVART